VVIRFGVLVVSDRTARGEREDLAGKTLMELIKKREWLVERYAVVPDNVGEIVSAVKEMLGSCDFVITSGGTGFGKKDYTPEAVELLLERKSYTLPAYIVFKTASLKPTAALSRAVCGVSGSTFVITFPGSRRAVVEWWQEFEPMVEHIYELLNKDVVTCGG